MRMFDHFDLEGPNGTHKCFALELLGPSVPDMAERYRDYRLPGGIAKAIAKQALSGLDALHQEKIAHGGELLALLVFGGCVLKLSRSPHEQPGFHST